MYKYKSVEEFSNALEKKEAELTIKIAKDEKELNDWITNGKLSPNMFHITARSRHYLIDAIDDAKKELKGYQKLKEKIKQVCSTKRFT